MVSIIKGIIEGNVLGADDGSVLGLPHGKVGGLLDVRESFVGILDGVALTLSHGVELGVTEGATDGNVLGTDEELALGLLLGTVGRCPRCSWR